MYSCMGMCSCACVCVHVHDIVCWEQNVERLFHALLIMCTIQLNRPLWYSP